MIVEKNQVILEQKKINMNIDINKLRDLIVELQKKSGFNQEEFANLVGVTQAAYSHFSANEVKSLDIKRVNEYATVLGITFTELIDLYKTRYESESESKEQLWRRIEILMQVYQNKNK
jgi:transcriptional regulator with XRE-family HTH domain